MWRLDLDESFCLASDIIINDQTIWNNQLVTCADIFIQDGGLLTINNQLVLSDNAKITIEDGGQLIINGADVINADIEVFSGGYLSLANGAIVSLLSDDHFKVRKGAVLQISDGSITTNN